MTDQPQQTKPNDHRYYPEDEIVLMDYLLVIWKWKYLILAGTFPFALVAAIISFTIWKQQPTMYRTNIVFEPGVVEIDKDGNKGFIDSPQNIKALIEIILKYDIKSSNSQVDIPKGSNKIDVSLEYASADEGTTKSNYLIKALLSSGFANKVRAIQKGIDEAIQLKKHEFDKLLFKVKSIKAKIEKYQQGLLEMEANIKLLKESKDISSSKELLLNKLSIEHDFLSTFQKYFEKNENAKYSLFEIQKEKNKLSKEIKKLEEKKLSIQGVQIVQPPVTIELPKTNKIKRNIALSSVLGLFLMLFLSFFLEYLSKYKKRV